MTQNAEKGRGAVVDRGGRWAEVEGRGGSEKRGGQVWWCGEMEKKKKKVVRPR